MGIYLQKTAGSISDEPRPPEERLAATKGKSSLLSNKNSGRNGKKGRQTTSVTNLSTESACFSSQLPLTDLTMTREKINHLQLNARAKIRSRPRPLFFTSCCLSALCNQCMNLAK